MTVVVYGIIGGVFIFFNFLNINGCKDLGIKCFVVVGIIYDYINIIFVFSVYFKVCVFIIYWKKVILIFIIFNNIDKV